jgi:hypothetical protein
MSAGIMVARDGRDSPLKYTTETSQYPNQSRRRATEQLPNTFRRQSLAVRKLWVPDWSPAFAPPGRSLGLTSCPSVSTLLTGLLCTYA